jgi:hypothetical protein
MKFATMLLFATAVQALAQQDAKGIYLDDHDSRPAMKFNVLLDRSGSQQVVPATHTFHDGDRMKFRFEVSKDSYIYVLHRSVEADGDRADRYSGARGIEVIRDDDKQSKKGSYQLLFPNQASGQSNLVRAHTVKAVPGTESAYFRMDERPGMEKLLVVVSAKPIDIAKFFDVRSGKQKAGGTDTDDDVLDQLSRTLMEYSGNSDVQSAKGIDVVDGYAAPKDGAKPMVVAVDLKHTH